jgi:hypothetical protein
MHRSAKRKTAVQEKDWTKEMYSLWHKWLCKSDESEWSDDVKNDYAKAKSMPDFDDWWALMHKDAQPIGYDELVFEEIQTVEHFNSDNSYPHDESNFSSRIFRIEFWAPKHILHEQLDMLIALYHRDHESGHQNIGISNLSFTLEKKATKRFVTTVETIWKVYEMAEGWRDDRRYKADGPSLAEIGRKCGLRANGDQFDNPNQLMAQTVSRYIKWGRQIAEHLLIGEFPVYNLKGKP